jgi:hypothetical protein
MSAFDNHLFINYKIFISQRLVSGIWNGDLEKPQEVAI